MYIVSCIYKESRQLMQMLIGLYYENKQKRVHINNDAIAHIYQKL